MSTEGVSIEVVPFSSQEAAQLVAWADAELDERYGGPTPLRPFPRGGTPRRPLTEADFSPPLGAFVVARLGAALVGGAGFRPLPEAPGAAEVKRLWVEPARRRAGIARRLMKVVEELAARSGYRILYLETGPAQPEAVALYEGEGWRRRPPYPGGAQHEQSTYFEKNLG